MQLFRSKLFIVFLGVILLLAGFSLAREVLNTLQIRSEIAKLKAEADSLEKKNQELKGLAQYLSSDDYKELAAREQLNLKAPGEVAVAIPPISVEEAREYLKPPVETLGVTETSNNFSKWWDYFFGPKTWQ